MKEKRTVRERTIVIDIKLTRGLIVALSCVLATVGLLAYLALTGERAVASEMETAQAASTGMRQYYLTDFPEGSGSTARTACAQGYHFASLWELADPSNLKYNNFLGFTRPDSGQGPPSEAWGWVRTGYTAESSDTQTPGRANCNGWTSSASNLFGTVANLPEDWTSGDQDMGVWNAETAGCLTERRVWCIED